MCLFLLLDDLESSVYHPPTFFDNYSITPLRGIFPAYQYNLLTSTLSLVAIVELYTFP